MRHFGRRRRSRPIRPSTIHIPSEMGISISANNSNAGVVLATTGFNVGESAQSTVNVAANRDQLVVTGSKLGQMTVHIVARGAGQSGSGVLEYAFFKVERSAQVPTSTSGQLPGATEILNDGLQQAERIHNPGRVIHFGLIAFAGQQPGVRVIKLPWAKFKLAGVRVGDYYMLHFFSRGDAVEVDYHCRFKEFK